MSIVNKKSVFCVLLVFAILFSGSQAALAAGPTVSLDGTYDSHLYPTIPEPGGRTYTIPIKLSAACPDAVTVTLSFSGTATFGTDYTVNNDEFTIPAGQTAANLEFTIADDGAGDNNETLSIEIASVVNGTEDGVQKLTYTIGEGTRISVKWHQDVIENLQDGAFQIELSSASSNPFDVTFTIRGTATAGVDYTPLISPVTIEAGVTTKTITVDQLDDWDSEVTKYVDMELTSTTYGFIAEAPDNTATLTVFDDDQLFVSLSQSTANISETGGSDTITASLNKVHHDDITVTLSFTGTAAPGTDYTVSGTNYNATLKTITILAGNLSGTATITASSDLIDEADETVIVDISSVTNGLESGTQQVTCTIDNAPSVSVNDPSVSEGNAGAGNLTFTVVLSTSSTRAVTVDYATADGTATAGSDYTACSGTLTYVPGETSKTVIVPVSGDTAVESNETVLLKLSNPVNATISDPQGAGLILNDDAPHYIPPPAAPAAAIFINGVAFDDGALDTSVNANGQTVTTVTIDTSKLEARLALSGPGAVVTIPVTSDTDIASCRLSGGLLEALRNNGATLVLQTGAASYSLSAASFDMAALTALLGGSDALAGATFTVSIAEASPAMAAAAERVAQNGGYTLIVPALDFTITCTSGNQTFTIGQFDSYVERRILLPDGTDPSRITTALVVNPDATAYPVPTRTIGSSGHHYAVISSLTNSTYAVIYHPLTFTDIADHWGRDAINDLGARLVITGTGDNRFSPGADISRGEFSAIVVRALGLGPGTGAVNFSDVNANDWYCGYVQKAAAYGLITGFSDGTFRPGDTITREQAMTIIARAMKLTGLEASLTSDDIRTILDGFTDASAVAAYARLGTAECIKTGLVSGRNGLIDPDADITRGEVAVLVQRLLQKSGLI